QSAGSAGRRGRSPRSAGSWSCSAGRCAWHLPDPAGRCSRDEFDVRLGVGLVLAGGFAAAVAGAGVLLVPAALDVAADARSGGDGQGAGLEVAVEPGAVEQLHALGRFDVAVEVAGDGDLLGAHAAVEPGAALDGEVALDVDVALELAGDADVAGAFDLALDGQVGRNQRLL